MNNNNNNELAELPMITINLNEVESTHLWCLANLEKLLLNLSSSNFLRVSSNIQSAGVGQYTNDTNNKTRKRWIYLPGNIACNFILIFNKKLYGTAHNFSKVLSCAIHNCVLNYGIEALIKLPNDIIVDEKKIAGMICDIVSPSNLHNGDFCLVVGVGINVKYSPNLSDFIVNNDEVQFATSLLEEIYKIEGTKSTLVSDKNITDLVMYNISYEIWKAYLNFNKYGISASIDYLNKYLYKKDSIIKAEEYDNLYNHKNETRKTRRSFSGLLLGVSCFTGNVILKVSNGEEREFPNIKIIY